MKMIAGVLRDGEGWRGFVVCLCGWSGGAECVAMVDQYIA